MSNNLFYKTLSIIGTLGIVVLSSSQVLTTFQNQDNSEAEISKTLAELKKAKRETLSEINIAKKDVLKDLDETLEEVVTYKRTTLSEVKIARKEALNAIGEASGDVTKVWLVLKYGGREDVPGLANKGGFNFAINSIPMKDIDTCEIMGAQWISSPRAFDGRYNYEKMAYVCLEE